MENTQIWTEIQSCLKEHLSFSGYQTFLSSAKPQTFSNHILTIEVPNAFSKDWMKDKCEPVLRTHFKDTPFDDLICTYVIVRDIQDDAPVQMDMFSMSSAKPIVPESGATLFNPKYTFDNFVVGHNNRFAYAAAEAVAKAPVKAYNPLFIYGSVGLGKTHLLHAIALKAKELHPHMTSMLVSSEKFTNDLINSIKDKKVDAFREKYRNVDILIVDDIQFLAGKEQTQEEFFHTFNDLHGKNKQVILTSDRPPKEIPTLELRLRTRFEWGLAADIQAPELETRIAILRKKVELNSFYVSDEILYFIASQVPSNVREMEGALNRIVAYASLLNTEVTLSIASNVIKDMVGNRHEKPLTISAIKRKVCDYFTLTLQDLNAKNRTKDVSHARQIAMYLARELTNVSLPKIGENFGNRDHSTVMHACDKIKSLIANDEATRNVVTLLISNIKNAD